MSIDLLKHADPQKWHVTDVFCNSAIFKIALRCNHCGGCCKKLLNASWVETSTIFEVKPFGPLAVQVAKWRKLYAAVRRTFCSCNSWIWGQLPGCFTLLLPGLIFSHAGSLGLTLGLHDCAFCVESGREGCVIALCNALILDLCRSCWPGRQMNKKVQNAVWCIKYLGSMEALWVIAVKWITFRVALKYLALL